MDFLETKWTDVINITSVRNQMEKGECIKLKYFNKPCVLITETQIACNSQFVDCTYIYDDVLFIKIKETIID